MFVHTPMASISRGLALDGVDANIGAHGKWILPVGNKNQDNIDLPMSARMSIVGTLSLHGVTWVYQGM